MLKNLDNRPKSSATGFHTDKRVTLLDELETEACVDLIVCEGIEATRAVARCTKEIAQAIDLSAERIKRGGRFIGIGAGTSGRQIVMNLTECEPTYGTGDKFIGLIAGGNEALIRSVEGAEDDEESAREQLRAIGICENDVLCGIAASGTTPYTRSALAFAKASDCFTVFITGKTVEPITADISIHLDVGPEVIDKSTRMKAGTAQKETLDVLTSQINVKLGRTYGGLMVDMKLTNSKLYRRAIDMIHRLTDLSEEDATALLTEAMALKCERHGPVKIATVMHHRAMDAEQAVETIEKNDGFLRKIIGDIDYTKERSVP